MRKLLILVLAACCIGTFSLEAQNGPLFAAVKKDGKWGFIDTSGKMVIQNIFNDAKGFSEGVANVRMANLWGFINSKGLWSIKPNFTECAGFHENYALTTIIDHSDLLSYPTYITHRMRVIFVLDPREIGWDFNDGLVKVRSIDANGAAYGYRDSTGTYVIKPRYDAATDFHEGEAAVMLGKQWGFIDKAGKDVIFPKFDDAYAYNEGLAYVRLGNDIQFINKKGKTVFHAPYDEVGRLCRDGMIAVRKNGKVGFINNKGKLKIEPQFDNANTLPIFTEGMAPITLKQDGKELWGFIDKKGKMKIKPQYESASNFYNGYAIVKINGKYGFINSSGRLAIPAVYEDAHEYNYSER